MSSRCSRSVRAHLPHVGHPNHDHEPPLGNLRKWTLTFCSTWPSFTRNVDVSAVMMSSAPASARLKRPADRRGIGLPQQTRCTSEAAGSATGPMRFGASFGAGPKAQKPSALPTEQSRRGGIGRNFCFQKLHRGCVSKWGRCSPPLRTIGRGGSSRIYPLFYRDSGRWDDGDDLSYSVRKKRDKIAQLSVLAWLRRGKPLRLCELDRPMARLTVLPTSVPTDPGWGRGFAFCQ
jgi:hypothetical protein